MSIIYQKIESSTEIQWKIIPWWLISKSCLNERLEFDTGKASTIVIIVGLNKKTAKLFSKQLRFGEALKFVKKFCEAGPGSVCLRCARISHDCPRKYANKAIQCVICRDTFEAETWRCRIIDGTVNRGKICTHVKLLCTNCGIKYLTTTFKYLARVKAQVEAKREKSKKIPCKR